MEAGFKHQEKENPYKREDIELMFDELMFPFIERIPDFFRTSPRAEGTETETPKQAKKKNKGFKPGGNQGTAAALLGYNEDDFDRSTPREIYFAFKAFAEERSNQVFELNKMRLQTMPLYNLQIPKETDRIKDPRELLIFQHDDPLPEAAEIKIPTPEEWEEMDRRLAEIHNKKEA